MKKTKSIIMLLLSFAVLLLLTNNVSAFDGSTTPWDGCPIKKLDNTGDVVKFQIEREAKGETGIDFEVKKGQKVELDLNGKTLCNFTDGCSTIYVEDGGTLTIVDTSEKKEGKIEQKENSKGLSTIYNAGNLIIEAGAISDTTGKTDNIATVTNAATGTLEIKGGSVTGTKEAVINLGTATISGGTIDEKGDFYAIRNEGKLNMTNGTVKSSSTKTSVIGNIGKNNPELTVSGGKVEGQTAAVVNYNGEANLTGVEKVHLNGGKVTVDEKSKVTYGEGLVVKVGDTYYADNEATDGITGETSATDIVEQLKKDGKAELTVVQGELTVTGAAEGFTVKKEGEGKVTVNGVEVINSYTVPEKATSEQGEEEKDEKEPTPDTGVENVYAIAGVIAVAAIAGAIILNKRK